ncbi:tectonin beta-propeller repeat-containing protein [Adelges cooleyi]|uniref:tectonin beta-propeller repeat-containing protein n=1 Tax=Adelges cooleyi TaxID=133065 RepID=UPI0021805203|nr:tectonin beta-propeller repeat-containing protein [Adelges cooleyi]
MNKQLLFAINNYGKIFSLATSNDQWVQFPNACIDLKHISAIENFIWSIGSDNQTYLLVHNLTEAIQIKEEVYENERWIPGGNFSKRLLPTDRYCWSSENGKDEKFKENIKLPSFLWQWEHEWKLQTTLDDQDLDDDGWTYAIDFYATFYPQKRWNSYVRRRKWFRTRIYTGVNSWCIISPLHRDFTQEPFICVSIGGNKIPGSQSGFMMVWAVTAQGRIFYRKNVNKMFPEGSQWLCVPAKEGSEARYIECSPTGSVWVVMWNGILLVRKGVDAKLPQGRSWVVVASPESDSKIIQLSVGCQTVWAVTNDSRVWIRKDVENNIEGTCWAKLNTSMLSVSVSPNDQVFAVGLDRHLYFRNEVTKSNLIGNKWICIKATIKPKSYQEKKSDQEETFVSSSSFTQVAHSAPMCLTENGSRGALDLNIKEINPSHRRVSAWSPKHSIGSLVGTEAKPTQLENKNNVSIENTNTIFWSEIIAGAVEPNPEFIYQWLKVNMDCKQVFKSKWRCMILDSLKNLRLQEKQFQHFACAL